MNDKSNPYSAPDTGHVWDDSLRELTNNPPTWWRIGFHASWIVVLAYGFIYPMWPMLTTHTKGMTGWTSIGEYKQDLKAIEGKRSQYEQRLQGMGPAAIVADPELSRYVKASGKVLFGDNCAACHGSKGQGNPGYPVLSDDDWLYGGEVNTIAQSIANGRTGMMPAHGKTLSAQEIDDLAQHVVALGKGQEHAAGKEIFMGKGACFACHGMDGSGNPMLGAANLTDSIWRFEAKDQLASVKYTITHGVNDPQDGQTRNAVMPKFGGGKLSEGDITKLAAYVHMLGGGK